LHVWAGITGSPFAETVGAAYALAYAGAEPRIVVPPGQVRDFLEPLPVAALRIDVLICQRLERVGICTIGQLLRLPRSALALRFGPQPVLRLQQALGEVFEGVATRYPPTILGSRLEFDLPAKQLPKIEPAVDLLLRELFLQMQRRNLALRQLECILYGPRRPPRVLSIEFVRPCRREKHAAAMLKQRLERVLLTEGVSGLAVVARQTAPWHAEQADLFCGEVSAEAEKLTALLDRLVNRLGQDAVVQVELEDEYQPEVAFRYVPVSRAFERAGRLRFVLPGTTAGRLRPTVLLPRPQPIRVISKVPDGPPLVAERWRPGVSGSRRGRAGATGNRLVAWAGRATGLLPRGHHYRPAVLDFPRPGKPVLVPARSFQLVRRPPAVSRLFGCPYRAASSARLNPGRPRSMVWRSTQ
jgi:protein ImuB